MLELLLIAGVLIWVAVVYAYMRRGNASIFHPMTYFLAFHGFVFVLRPLFNYYYDFDFVYNLYEFRPSSYDQVMALLAAHVGFVTFAVVNLAIGREPFVPLPTAGMPGDRQRATREAFILSALLCLPVAVYSLRQVLQEKFANTSTMVMVNGVSVNTTGNGYLHDANNMLIPIVVLIAWQYRFRLWSLIPFALYAGLRLFVGTSRWTFVMAAASMAILFLYDRRQRWFTSRILLAGAVVLAAFTIAGAQRSFFRDLVTGHGERQQDDVFAKRPLEGMDYANQEYLEYIIYAVPQRTGTYDYFTNSIQVLTEPIPRVLWHNKPIGAPIQFFSLWDYGNPIGMTPSIYGIGWVGLGLIGVVLWCALFGGFFGWTYRAFVRSRQTPFQVAIYATLLPLSIQFFRDGGMLTLAKYPLFYLVPIALWKLLAAAGFRRRPSAPRLMTPGLSARPNA